MDGFLIENAKENSESGVEPRITDYTSFVKLKVYAVALADFNDLISDRESSEGPRSDTGRRLGRRVNSRLSKLRLLSSSPNPSINFCFIYLFLFFFFLFSSPEHVRNCSYTTAVREVHVLCKE